ncbi:Cellulose binding elicitor lectin (CBEL) [Phytophthora palmivora]|uniref:Cellulose binding elicitor lectin (CBEL) n=1 Tax=Phytophthora palmivora TaxID=4796 RepID=A0A2P4XH46_9STRA|nr:Cellulose binding elicitor lectin (CBEL) [Phytophthora palmivora]
MSTSMWNGYQTDLGWSSLGYLDEYFDNADPDTNFDANTTPDDLHHAGLRLLWLQQWGYVLSEWLLLPAQLTDKDYYGNDIKTVYVSLPSLCCDACASTAGCKAYTYINNNPGQPVCYLKSAAGTATTKVGAVSGTLN